jgi:23S rRNA pseudouridine2605 synthase
MKKNNKDSRKSGSKNNFTKQKGTDFNSSRDKSYPGKKKPFNASSEDKKSFGNSRGKKDDEKLVKNRFNSARGDKPFAAKKKSFKKFTPSEKNEKTFGSSSNYNRPRGSKSDFKKSDDSKGYSKSKRSDYGKNEEKSFNPKKKTFKQYRDSAKENKSFGADRYKKSDKPGAAKFGADKKRPAKKHIPFVDKNSISEPPIYNLKPTKPAKSKTTSKSKKEVVEGDDKIRLNKYISNAGVCSRRDADILIQNGQVTVNGKVVTELGYKVEKNDLVGFNGKVLKSEKHVYVLLNKPKDFLTTTEDPEDRKTVMALVKNACKERIYPVGRLDRHTTGLLLFTNDGELADKLTHPSNNIKKVYQADLDKPISREDFDKIVDGLQLEDGPVRVDSIAILTSDRTSIGLEIHEGRNRIVRRIFEHLGYEVVKLDRVMYAGLTKKDLPRGKWRYLSEKEVIRLKHFV